MRRFIDIVSLAEARAPRPTRTRTTDPTMFNIPVEPGAENPVAVPPSGTNPPVPGGPADQLPGQTMGGAEARRRARMANLPPEAGPMIGNIMGSGIEDEIDDAEAMRRAGGPMDGTPEPPRNPQNLPAVVSRALVQAGQGDFNPEWIMVRHLPGYMQNAIRALGRQVFRQFTDTPLEDIQVMTTLTHPQADVQRMFAFIRQNAIRDDVARIDFQQIVPGFDADVQLWRMMGYEFLLVRDFAGYYVYGWPGGRGTRLDAPTAPRRIGR